MSPVVPLVRTWAQEGLADLESRGLLRQRAPLDSPQGPVIAIEGQRLINFSSNDYLGLASHPAVIEAARQALEAWGMGAGASRLVAGELEPHRALEARLATFEKAESALVFNSGYVANLGTVSALMGEGDAIFSDQLNHASLIDGCRLSKARTVVYPHTDMNALEGLLKVSTARRKLVCSDTVFSMDGDVAPLGDLVALCERYAAVLYVDEAHATGVLGQRGAGLCEVSGLEDEVDVRMGTLGKALGVLGAYVTGPRELTSFLFNVSRAFVYTTALPPAVCAAAERAVQLVEEGTALRARLWGHIQRFAAGASRLGFDVAPRSAIFPLVLGTPKAALDASESLRRQGYWVRAIRPPTVPEGTSRLRVALSAAHEDAHVDGLLDALASLKVPHAAISP